MESVGFMNYNEELVRSFDGKTVLVTGHTGFKGGWLVLWLESLGARVIGYSLAPPTEPSFFNKTRLGSHITDIRGDVLDFEELSRVIDKHHPDFVFHLAAQPLVRASYRNPRETFDVNVMGTANVLEAIRISRNPAICVCITSDKCYENREWEYAYRENDPLGGHDPYSASKGAAELVIAAYRQSFFAAPESGPVCELSSVRAGNIIGGGDWAEDRLVPDCIRSLAEGKIIRIRNPSAIRPWQFVLDPLFGYLWLAHNMKEHPKEYSGAWNFGPEYSNNVNVRAVSEKIIREWGCGALDETHQATDLHEAGLLKLDIAKSVTKLGWKPVYGIDDAIRKTVEWYKVDDSGTADLYAFSRGQIESYLNDVNKRI